MTDSVQKAVERAIATIRTNYAEDVTIDDLARVAMFSKFHFTRVFRRTTGVSPGRFLSAVRLQEAKRLLTSTSLSIADVSREVGYHSVGTFSSRFARSVGLSPAAYRKLGGPSATPVVSAEPLAADAQVGSVQGRIWSPDDRCGAIYTGVFPSRIPEGPPARCTVLDRPGCFQLDRVPVGRYYLLCQSIVPSDERDDGARPPTAVGASGPIVVFANQVTRSVELCLKPIRPVDPPVLLALTPH